MFQVYAMHYKYLHLIVSTIINKQINHFDKIEINFILKQVFVMLMTVHIILNQYILTQYQHNHPMNGKQLNECVNALHRLLEQEIRIMMPSLQLHGNQLHLKKMKMVLIRINALMLPRKLVLLNHQSLIACNIGIVFINKISSISFNELTNLELYIPHNKNCFYIDLF